MRRNNKNKIFLYFLIVVFTISVGYAAINRTLNITGNSEIKQNTWDIYFDNIIVKSGSVSADSLPVIDATTKSTVSFNVMLNLPGDFYEFTVDVVNHGTIDAMIDSIVKTPELNESQKKYFNYIIEYNNVGDLANKQSVKSGSYVRLKVRVEYRTDLNGEDLPSETENLALGFLINYTQADSTFIEVENSGTGIIPTANGSLDSIGTLVTIGTEQFYTIGTDGDNVKLFAKYNLYVGNEVLGEDSESGEYIVKPIDNPNGMQNNRALGVNWNPDLMFPIIGTVGFYADNTSPTELSNYGGVETHINNYKAKLEEKFGVNIVEARPISFSELRDEKIGCSLSGCLSAPSFIYSTSYWTGTSYNNYTIYTLSSNNSFFNDGVGVDYFFGVRPVVVMKKSDITVEAKVITFTINNRTYYSEEGMTWEDWCNSDYNVNNYYIEENNIIDAVGLIVNNVSATDLISSNGTYELSGGDFGESE